MSNPVLEVSLKQKHDYDCVIRVYQGTNKDYFLCLQLGQIHLLAVNPKQVFRAARFETEDMAKGVADYLVKGLEDIEDNLVAKIFEIETLGTLAVNKFVLMLNIGAVCFLTACLTSDKTIGPLFLHTQLDAAKILADIYFCFGSPVFSVEKLLDRGQKV